MIEFMFQASDMNPTSVTCTCSGGFLFSSGHTQCSLDTLNVNDLSVRGALRSNDVWKKLLGIEDFNTFFSILFVSILLVCLTVALIWACFEDRTSLRLVRRKTVYFFFQYY